MTPRSILIALAAVALLALTASAYPQDLQGMPNGASYAAYGITLGHPGGATRKTTGIANGYYGAGKRWSQAFCQADSDGDGQSNGLEMGDPCCVWTVGATPMFTSGLSNPNSAADTTSNEMPNCAALAAEFQAMAQRTSAVRPMQIEVPEVAQDKQPCDVCIAKLVAKNVEADDAAKICKLLQCIPAAAPTAAPKATTAAPKATTAAPKQAMAAASKVPCDKCIAELTEKFVPADDAAEICMKVLKCQPAAVPKAALQAMTANLNIPCDKCIAEGVEHGADADDAAFVCQKVLKCKPAAVPTAAPKTTTAAPKATTAALKQLMAVAAKLPCDKCIAELTEEGADADNAAFVCQKVLKCQAAAAPVAMWSTFSNFATAAAGVPFSDCSAAGHTLQVTSVALNPNPPQKGQNVAISISGNLAAAVGSATAQLTVSLGAFQVLAQNFQLPAAAAGAVTQTVNIVVPGFAPSGTYTAKGVITSGGQQLACISASFNL